MDRSVPQALEVPVIGAAVVVQVPHGAAPGLHPPVLAVAAVLPPPALDPPPADHVHHLVPAVPPPERGRHAAVGLHLDPDLVVVALRHGACLPREADRKSTRLNSSHVANSYA